MHEQYNIGGAEHAPTYENLDDPNWCPDFQLGLERRDRAPLVVHTVMQIARVNGLPRGGSVDA